MNRVRFSPRFAVVLFVVGTSSMAVAQLGETPATRAKQILNATGVQGGLIVHLSCGDGTLTAALRVNDGYLVEGLDTQAENVKKARQHVKSLGLYGPVSVDRFDGKHLPYVDNLVNLVVAENLGNVPMAEVMRVLAPNGVAYIRQDGQWTKTVKPWPKQIDEWTHFLYDATNNAVSKDMVVGPPRQLQWVAGPEWARSHDHLNSVSACVSAGGRIFYIVDEGPLAAVVLQPRWRLVARDAFSGVILWKRPITKWQWHLRGFRSGPSDLARRLVAVGDRVYVTLDIEGPVCVLDAATGRTIETYEQTRDATEFIYQQGILFVVVGDGPRQGANAQGEHSKPRPGFTLVLPQRPAYIEKQPTKKIVAIDTRTGRVLWTRSDTSTAELMPTTLAANDKRVFFESPDEILCLDSGSGEVLWRADRPVSRLRPTWSAPTLVVHGDVVLSADRAVAKKPASDNNDGREVEWIVTSAGGQAPVGELIAFSAKDGRRLWSCPCRECYNAPVDVFVADGLVWTGNLVTARDPGITEGRDLETGEIRRTRPRDQKFFSPGMVHHRCYRNKATEQYLILGRAGAEFIDVKTGSVVPNNWTRGTCQYGIMPCNGLLYAPPHSCACFINAKLDGFNCLAPERRTSQIRTPDSQRLQKCPAYDQPPAPALRAASDEWPTYRHDNARSGHTATAVSPKLKTAWRTKLGGRLSSVTIAEGKVFVAQVDAHTIQALEADTGQRVWSYTAGGRVDSAPTIWQGRILFGCADGFVYCLRASDGALIWRFQAAPQNQRIVAYGQLESLWPVPGSVLVRDGIVYCAAGRSSYLDGGIRLCRLDAQTGRLLSETVLDDRDPNTGFQRKGVVRGMNMPGVLPDVLSCDGDSLFMRHSRFDLSGKPLPPDVPHLFSGTGFLDGAWWHRTYWFVGTAMGSGYGGWPGAGNRAPAGRLLVVGDSFIYGFGRNVYARHGAHIGIDAATIFHYRPQQDAASRFTYYQAFAISRTSSKGDELSTQAKRRGVSGRESRNYRWAEKVPVLARALVLAQNTLFLAGPPDIFATNDPEGALEGREGGVLCALSAADGKELARHDLDSIPVFDGMAAAYGRLYLSMKDGSLLCLAGR
jgi:outer membrane protein assembly factor BamB